MNETRPSAPAIEALRDRINALRRETAWVEHDTERTLRETVWGLLTRKSPVDVEKKEMIEAAGVVSEGLGKSAQAWLGDIVGGARVSTSIKQASQSFMLIDVDFDIGLEERSYIRRNLMHQDTEKDVIRITFRDTTSAFTIDDIKYSGSRYEGRLLSEDLGNLDRLSRLQFATEVLSRVNQVPNPQRAATS